MRVYNWMPCSRFNSNGFILMADKHVLQYIAQQR